MSSVEPDQGAPSATIEREPSGSDSGGEHNQLAGDERQNSGEVLHQQPAWLNVKRMRESSGSTNSKGDEHHQLLDEGNDQGASPVQVPTITNRDGKGISPNYAKRVIGDLAQDIGRGLAAKDAMWNGWTNSESGSQAVFTPQETRKWYSVCLYCHQVLFKKVNLLQDGSVSINRIKARQHIQHGSIPILEESESEYEYEASNCFGSWIAGSQEVD